MIGVITNPHSRKNLGRPGRAATLGRLLGDRGVVRETRSLEELGPAVDEMRALGVDTWVTDGGDGSLHWLLNAAATRWGLEALGPSVRLAVPANGGTIDFVARHAGVHGRAEQLLPRLIDTAASGAPLAATPVPTMLLRGVQEGPDGAPRPFQRIGFAAAVAGIGSGFFDQYYRIPGQGPRAIVEVIGKTSGSCLLDLGPWRGLAPAAWLDYGRVAMGVRDARVEIDGVALPPERFTAINVGAFPINLGGVVRVFQRAGPGRLHAIAGDLSILSMIRNLPRLYSGKALRSSALFDGPAGVVKVIATGPEPLRPVVDGELIEGVREVEVHPGPSVLVPRIDGRAQRRSRA